MQDSTCPIKENSHSQEYHKKHNERLKMPLTSRKIARRQNTTETQDVVITTQSGRSSRKPDHFTIQHTFAFVYKKRDLVYLCSRALWMQNRITEYKWDKQNQLQLFHGCFIDA